MPQTTRMKPGDGAVDLGELARVNQKSLENMVSVQSRMLRESMNFQAELLDFARRRLGAEIETQQQLAKCHSLNDAVQVVNEFCQTAVRDYTSEAAELMQRCVTIASESAQPDAGGDGGRGSGS